uniref:Uncharacterized protein n=1 Tax=Oncorhynchus mykiss TaxID=8022 RepID=A0A8C7PHF4_ONCMY
MLKGGGYRRDVADLKEKKLVEEAENGKDAPANGKKIAWGIVFLERPLSVKRRNYNNLNLSPSLSVSVGDEDDEDDDEVEGRAGKRAAEDDDDDDDDDEVI